MLDRPSMLRGLLQMKCPSCRKSPMFLDSNPYHFKMMGKMNKICPVCGHPMDHEAGYFFGAMYFSYAIMVAWNFSIALIIHFITGNLFEHISLMMTLAIVSTLAISPVMFRYSRVAWSYMFFKILRK